MVGSNATRRQYQSAANLISCTPRSMSARDTHDRCGPCLDSHTAQIGQDRTMPASSASPEVTFHFDPVCPYTWMTSRWAVEVTAARGVTLGWRALSLRVVNEGKIDEKHRAVMDAAFGALRVVEALADAGRHDDAGRFYTELGRRVHAGGRTMSTEVVDEAAAAAELGDIAGAARDETWDDAVVG